MESPVVSDSIIAINGYYGNEPTGVDARNWLSINGTLVAMSKQDTKAILARNLRRLMDRTPALDTQVKVAARASISQSTVGRLLRGEVYAQLSQVEALAEAFKVEVSSLLSERDAADVGITPEQERAYSALTAEQRKEVWDFITFLAAKQKGEATPPQTGPDERRDVPEPVERRIMEAIRRELNNDTLNLHHEREQETKSTRQHRRRTSSR